MGKTLAKVNLIGVVRRIAKALVARTKASIKISVNDLSKEPRIKRMKKIK